MRVALLTNLLTPYRLPVYRDLAATPGWQLRLFVSAASDPSRERAFDGAHHEGCGSLEVEIVSGLSLRRRVRTHPAYDADQWATLHVPWGAFGALRRFAPDVVVTSELGPRTAIASAYAALFGVPLVIWTYHARTSAAAVGPVRRALRRILLARGDAIVGMGVQAREVLCALGVSPERLFDAPNAHAADWWDQRLAALDRHAERLALRAALRTRERIALVAGRLEPVKGIAPLLDAWRTLPESARSGWTLLFVGDGPLAGAVAASQCSDDGIALLPAQRPDGFAAILVAADLLIFPSLGDTWGLVVNEAMACGIPVLCSRLAGCADDVVAPGENGWLFDPTDAADFRAALAAALVNPALPELGLRARDTAKRFGPATLANSLRRAILHAAARR